jgi:hypothetical protein
MGAAEGGADSAALGEWGKAKSALAGIYIYIYIYIYTYMQAQPYLSSILILLTLLYVSLYYIYASLYHADCYASDAAYYTINTKTKAALAGLE